MPYGPRSASSLTAPVTQMTAFIGTSISRQIGGRQSSRSTRSMAILSGGPLLSPLMPPAWRAGAGSPREWVFVQKCLLERKRSYLTEYELFSRKVVKGAATEPINFIKEESHGTRSTPHRHRT